MNTSKRNILMVLFISGMATSGMTSLLAMPLDDVDSQHRAKIVKERAKMRAAMSAQNGEKGKENGECGSQDIGNVSTGGGKAPREVNVFVLGDAINVVNGKCR